LTVYAQLQQRNQEDRGRYQHALETLVTAEAEINALIEDLKAVLERLNVQASNLKAQEQEASEEKKDASDDEKDLDDKKGTSAEKKGKGKERGSSLEDKRVGIIHRIREAEILLHKVTFFKGDVYHTLGAKYSKEEDAAYEKAEAIRKKLLKGEITRAPV
jgi:E3 ubiquitin-protein ligase SHPRH